jgi:opine dehydrogenase
MEAQDVKVAVLGSGNGGCAVAFDHSIHNHDVRIFDFENFPDNIHIIKKQRGIYADGKLEGFAPIEYAGHDIEEVLNNAEIVYVVGPAYSIRPFAEVCKPHLTKGQIVIICPGSSMGSIEFKNTLSLTLNDEDILIAETSTLPYAVRIVEPGKIHIFLKLEGGIFLAGVPSRITSYVLRKIRDIYPDMNVAKNVLQTSLQNGNPIIHPAITLLNSALIERTEGNFLFYEEGVTPAVGRLIKAMDEERITIGRKLGIDIISEPELGFMQGYMTEPTYDKGYSTAPGFRGIKAQTSLDHRYFHEDVGYGLVFWQSLAEQVEVETPYISATIRLASVLMEQDYLSDAARTMESLGLSEYNMEELKQLLN